MYRMLMGVCVIAGALSLMGAAGVVVSAAVAAGCAGVDATILDLSCSGSCTSGTCPSLSNGRGTDVEGKFAFCGCGNPVTEDPCCHLVRRYKESTDTPPVITWLDYDDRGSCPSCPLTGACKHRTVSGRVQALCE